MPFLIQFAVISLLASYIVSRRVALKHRNGRGWDSLVTQLPDRPPRIEAGAGHEVSVRELLRFRKQASVFLELADYAERNGTVDAAMLLSIRSDALAIRWHATLAIMTRVL